MELGSFTYEKMDYSTYEKRVDDISKDPRLVRLGLRTSTLGYTAYGYPLTEYTVGHGQKDLFIVGGTHGSEVIGVDFVTQLMSHIPDLKEYDPNIIAIHIIPLQNPEGFDISTQTLRDISNSELQKEGFDYYLRYRTDNVINAYLGSLNERLKGISSVVITPEVYLNTLKESFSSQQWINVCANNAIPDMVKFQQVIMNLNNYSDFNTLHNDILLKMERLKSDSTHPYFSSAVTRITNAIFSDEIMEMIQSKNEVQLNRNSGSRLYQERFANADLSGMASDKLSQDISLVYEQNNLPRGSQVKYDSTGEGINLNKNRPDNPGIEVQKRGVITYGVSPANNVRDNAAGPIGMAATNPHDFQFAFENVVLLRLLEKSAREGRLAGTLLYHGTGGLVYSKPFQDEENSKVTDDFVAYNDELSAAYKIPTEYRQIEKAEDTGFGDYLRKTYPGVLLIELSKMGGNPIAPYGDPNNIYSTFDNNLKAVDNVIKTIQEKNNKTR